MSRLTISRAALDLIESFEGFRARSAMLKNGTYTIGFGHSATARQGMQITREQAEELLRWDLRPIEDLVRQSCHTPINQNQFDALVSFAFNIGSENFSNSEVLRHLNQGEPVAAAIAMSAWRRASVNGEIIIVDALVRRRYAEVNLFFETAGARAAAPTNVVVPKIDYSAALLAPNPENIKEIIPTKANGEFEIKPNEAAQTAAEANAAPIDTPTAAQSLTPAAPPSVNPSPPAAVAMSGVPAKQAEAILDAKLGGDVLPFPDETLEEKQAANAQVQNEVLPANDTVPEQSAVKAKPHDVFRGQGIELKAPPEPPRDWFSYLPWLIAIAGALALLYGLYQMGGLEVFGALGFGDKSSEPVAIGPNGFRAIMIAICGFAALLLAVLSMFDKAENA